MVEGKREKMTNAVRQQHRNRTWPVSSLRVLGSTRHQSLILLRAIITCNLPGRNKAGYRPHSSSLQHYQTGKKTHQHVSWAQKGAEADKTHLSTIVWSRKQSDELSLCEKLVSVLYDLMRSADQIHVVLLQKARDDIGSECKRDTSIIFAPASDILVRIGPEQVAKQS